MMMAVRVVLVLAGVVAGQQAWACDASTFQLAAPSMNRFAHASTVDDAQLAAFSAHSAVLRASTSVGPCCFAAGAALDEVARTLRLATAEGEAHVLMFLRRRAMRAFNEAVEKWNSRWC
jgi:hypothetical protein